MKTARIEVKTNANVTDECLKEIISCFLAHTDDENRWLKEQSWIEGDDEVTAEIVE